MTEWELDAIKVRERTASPGPWRVMRVCNRHPSDAGDGQTHPALRGLRAPKRLYERACQQVEADMAFMAGAREDIPQLLAELDRLRAKLGEVRHELVELGREHPHDDATADLLAVVRLIENEERRWSRFAQAGTPARLPPPSVVTQATP